jgi:hypothetical protein
MQAQRVPRSARERAARPMSPGWLLEARSNPRPRGMIVSGKRVTAPATELGLRPLRPESPELTRARGFLLWGHAHRAANDRTRKGGPGAAGGKGGALPT